MARLARNTAVICLALAAGAVVVAPGWRAPLGVLGGGVLVGLTLWSFAGLAAALGSGDEGGAGRRVSAGGALVKFFTRHVILAAAAYVMMVRLHFDPIGMVVGVTSVVVAVSIEAARPR